MGKYRRKVDDNHKEIMNELRLLGYDVKSLHYVGEDFPDIIVSHSNFKNSYLIEIKTLKGKPSKGQLEFQELFKSIISSNTKDIVDKMLERESNNVSVRLENIG